MLDPANAEDPNQPMLLVQNASGWHQVYVDLELEISVLGYDLRIKSASSEFEVSIPEPAWKRSASRFGLTRRLLRLGIHGVDRHGSDELVVLITGAFFAVNLNTGSARELHRFRVGKRPLADGWLIDSFGRIVYGEYWFNDAKRAVNIWRSDEEISNWEVIASFPSGSIRHVHAIHPISDDLSLIATGDHDSESGIWSLENGRLSLIEGGSQLWRTVSLQKVGSDYMFGTDSPDEQNYIVRAPIDGSGELTKEIAVDGPVYYSRRVGDWLLFATTVERGKAETDDWVTLWYSKGDGEWQSYRVAQKDRLPNRYFGHAVLQFPRGVAPAERKVPVWVDAVGSSRQSNVRSRSARM